jgi:hypothetical protein
MCGSVMQQVYARATRSLPLDGASCDAPDEEPLKCEEHDQRLNRDDERARSEEVLLGPELVDEAEATIDPCAFFDLVR